MNQPMVFLQFTLKSGAFLRVAMSPMEAKEILKGWKEKKLASIIGEPFHPQGPWCIRQEDVSFMQVLDPEVLQRQQAQQVQLQQQQGRVWGPQNSGV